MAIETSQLNLEPSLGFEGTVDDDPETTSFGGWIRSKVFITRKPAATLLKTETMGAVFTYSRQSTSLCVSVWSSPRRLRRLLRIDRINSWIESASALDIIILRLGFGRLKKSLCI